MYLNKPSAFNLQGFFLSMYDLLLPPGIKGLRINRDIFLPNSSECPLLTPVKTSKNRRWAKLNIRKKRAKALCLLIFRKNYFI